MAARACHITTKIFNDAAKSQRIKNAADNMGAHFIYSELYSKLLIIHNERMHYQIVHRKSASKEKNNMQIISPIHIRHRSEINRNCSPLLKIMHKKTPSINADKISMLLNHFRGKKLSINLRKSKYQNKLLETIDNRPVHLNIQIPHTDSNRDFNFKSLDNRAAIDSVPVSSRAQLKQHIYLWMLKPFLASSKQV